MNAAGCTCLLFAVLSALSLTIAAPLNEQPNSQNSDDDLKQLIDNLKSMMSQDGGQQNLPADASKQESKEQMPPSKRNCAINFSNDCGSAERAYMNGMKNYFGNKRRLANPPRRQRVSYVSNSRQTPPIVAQPMKSEQQSVDDLALNHLLLEMVMQIRTKLSKDRQTTDKICIELTGYPCDVQAKK